MNRQSAYLFFLLFSSVLSRQLPNVTLVTYGSSVPVYLAALPYVVPAIEVAIANVEERFRFNIRHIVLTQPDIRFCLDLVSHTDLLAEYYYKKWDGEGIFAFVFGAGCSDIFPLADLSREWDTLLISSGVAFSELRNKTLYPTVITTGQPQFGHFAAAFFAFCQYFNWTTAAVIYDSSELNPFYYTLANVMKTRADKAESTVRVHLIPHNSDKPLADKGRDVLMTANTFSKIVVVAFLPNITRTLMVTASKLGMTSGNNAYFSFQPFDSLRRFGNLSWYHNDTDDEVALHAFESLFQVTGNCINHDNGSLSRHHMNEVLGLIKDRTKKLYNLSFGLNEQPSDTSLASYYAVEILAEVLNEESRSDHPNYSGKYLASLFWNRSFHFESGSVTLNKYGERVVDICFRNFRRNTSSFKGMMYYVPQTKKLLTYPEDDDFEDWQSNKTALSSEPSQPPELIADAYSNYLSVTWIVATLSTAVLLGALVSLVVWFRQRGPLPRGNWWRVRRNELLCMSGSDIGRPQSSSQDGGGRVLPRSPYCFGIYFYKDRLVRLRRISTTQDFPPNRQALRCLWELQSITSDNLTKLYGICTGTDELFFVYEYGEKGSLMNIIKNSYPSQEIKISLVNDLIEGLCQIHRSFLKRHGFLSPYVCKINKRFTLKITDFGIYDIGMTVNTQWEDIDRNLELDTDPWVAPEFKTFPYLTYNLLTLTENGNPEADMFSFGGIVASLFAECKQASVPHELINACTFVHEIVRQCQKIVPGDRLSIGEVKAKFRDFVGAGCEDFFGRILQKMETYLSQLEADVLEKTKALKYERDIGEKLLTSMLPSFVPDPVSAWTCLTPQRYENVTVLYSIFLSGLDLSRGKFPLHLFEDFYDLESVFGSAVYQFDTSLIETNTSCYLIAGGLSSGRLNRHATRDVCRVSVLIREELRRLNAPLSFQLRMGMDTGTCIGAVVGHRRPQYCLLGLNIMQAKYLASHSKPYRVHVSRTTAELITVSMGDFSVTPRQIAPPRDKEEQTFWLDSKNTFISNYG